MLQNNLFCKQLYAHRERTRPHVFNSEQSQTEQQRTFFVERMSSKDISFVIKIVMGLSQFL